MLKAKCSTSHEQKAQRQFAQKLKAQSSMLKAEGSTSYEQNGEL